METIVFLGDSITDANRIESKNGLGFGYVNQVACCLQTRYKGLNIINKGVDGFITERITRNLPNDCFAYQPDYVCILVGINDIGLIMNTVRTKEERTYLLEDSLRAYHQLLFDLNHNTQARVLTMEPFIFPHPQEYANWVPWQQKLAKQIHKLARNYHAAFVPLQKRLNQKVKLSGYDAVTTDGIHLTSLGHQVLADSVLSVLQDVLPLK